MDTLMTHAAWALAATSALSLAYELYRATAKAGTSAHDSLRAFATRGLPTCALAGGVVALLLTGAGWAAWVGLAFSAAMILVAVLYYNPRVLPARRPGLIDWAEDLVYTGLLLVAAALLLHAVAGKRLS